MVVVVHVYVAVSDLMNVLLNIQKSQNTYTVPRQIQGSMWGYLCASESPEGSACGVVTHYALHATHSVQVPLGAVRDLLDQDEDS